MSEVRLKQLAQDGATADQHVEWDAASGLWVPATPALVLVDHVSALADTTAMTLTGLASETDGAYLIVGRISADNNSAFELRPNGIAQTNIRSWWNQAANNTATGFTLNSTTGWIIGGGLSADASSRTVFMFQGWIWPSTNRHGSTGSREGTRLYRSIGVQDGNNAGENRMESWGVWTDNTVASWSSLLVGGFGSTMERGSEVMLYKAKY